jgi:hypothetical protein
MSMQAIWPPHVWLTSDRVSHHRNSPYKLLSSMRHPHFELSASPALLLSSVAPSGARPFFLF